MKYNRWFYAKGGRRAALPVTVSLAASLCFNVLAAVPSSGAATGEFTPSTTNSGPKISFGEPIFAFGKVDSGTLVKHDYIFTNTGNQTLEVTKVQPGCGCTTASPWDKTVEPGKTGTIPIQFNSTGYGGQIVKTITVSCNDPDQTNLILQLKGTVWKPIDVIPTFAMFNIYPDTPTNETKVVRIVSNLEEPLTLSEPVCSNSTFQAALRTVKEGKEFELRVTVLPPLTSTVSAQINLKTSSKKMPTLAVTAYATSIPPIAVTPSQITLPSGPLAVESKPTITIKNNSTNSLALSDPAINAAGADLQLKETQPGRAFVVDLKFPAGFQIPPGQAVEATLKTTNPNYPLLKIPIYQMPPAATAPSVPSKPASTQNSSPPQGLASATSSAPPNSQRR